MSQENVELVRKAFAAWERGEISECLELMSERLVTYRAHPDGATSYGVEGFLEMTADWIEGFAEWSITGEKFIDRGDNVLVRTRQTARGEASDIAVDSEWWFIFTIRDSKAVRVEMHSDRSEAFKAVGLSGQ